ncbi:MAG TPA: hypothetical protein VFR90_04580 [Methylibium sp.]|nr:hypothetical protein [Methylibium sp.]
MKKISPSQAAAYSTAPGSSGLQNTGRPAAQASASTSASNSLTAGPPARRVSMASSASPFAGRRNALLKNPTGPFHGMPPAKIGNPGTIRAEHWREFAGPGFDEKKYERQMKLQIGWDFKFRSDEYDSDSEDGEFDNVPKTSLAKLLESMDPQARAERFESKTNDLKENFVKIAVAKAVVQFTQLEYLERFGARDNPGVCAGLSLLWLQSGIANPSMSSQERIDFLSSSEETANAIRLQSDVGKVQLEMPFRRYHSYKEIAESSSYLQGIKLGKLLLCKGGPDITLSDLADQISARLLHARAGQHHLIDIYPMPHAWACEKAGDRFRIFESNAGVFEAASEELPELVAALLMNHIDSLIEQNGQPLKSLIEKAYIRVLPVFRSTDSAEA